MYCSAFVVNIDKNKKHFFRDQGSLYPYYTGIHLHYYCSWEQYHYFFVLILIILEYIYITVYPAMVTIDGVLILIILEYIYIIFLSVMSSTPKCLNPYYTGIHLHIYISCHRQMLNIVLILIILEYIYILLAMAVLMLTAVLILIILEYIYIMDVSANQSWKMS